jgi:hypothetical protein
VGDGEILTDTGDGAVHRYRIADGTEVADSAFTHDPGTPDAEIMTVHPSEHLLALTLNGGVDVWNLDTRQREARLVLPDAVTPERLRFGDDPDDLEITVRGERLRDTDPAQGSMIMLWERNRLWGLPKVVGQSAERTRVLSGVPAEPGYPNAGPYELGGFESAKPDDWLAAVCRVMRDSGLDVEPDNLPDGAWRGPVCT